MTVPAETPPLVYRLPRWQPALLFLVTAALAGYAIYSSGSGVVVFIVAVIAVAFGIAAVAATRMYLVADDDGIGIRRFVGENSLDWDHVSGIAVAKQRGGALTLEVQSHDGTALRVPPSLVLPLRPTNLDRTRALLTVKAREVSERRPAGSLPPGLLP